MKSRLVQSNLGTRFFLKLEYKSVGVRGGQLAEPRQTSFPPPLIQNFTNSRGIDLVLAAKMQSWRVSVGGRVEAEGTSRQPEAKLSASNFSFAQRNFLCQSAYFHSNNMFSSQILLSENILDLVNWGFCNDVLLQTEQWQPIFSVTRRSRSDVRQ